jgi:hypothetical protein
MVLGPCELCATSVGWPRACGCRFDPVTAMLMADPASVGQAVDVRSGAPSAGDQLSPAGSGSVADPAGPCCGDLAWPDLRAR